MSAPTVWEEGHWSGRLVTVTATVAALVCAGLDAAITGHLGLIFATTYVVICVAGSLLVHPRYFFNAGVLPPLVLLVVAMVFSLLDRGAVATGRAGLSEALISGLAGQAAALVVGYALVVSVLLTRNRVIQRHPARRYPVVDYVNLAVSPAPERTISATPEERSTTVVGADEHGPDSTIASNS